MIVYEILPLVGVGPLRFGMTRPEARRAMNLEPDTFYKHQNDPYPVDGYHFTTLQVIFDPVDRVACVEVSPNPAFEARFKGFDVHAVPAEDLLTVIAKEAAIVGEEVPSLELRFWKPSLDHVRFSTIAVGRKGYFSRR